MTFSRPAAAAYHTRNAHNNDGCFREVNASIEEYCRPSSVFDSFMMRRCYGICFRWPQGNIRWVYTPLINLEIVYDNLEFQLSYDSKLLYNTSSLPKHATALRAPSTLHWSRKGAWREDCMIHTVGLFMHSTIISLTTYLSYTFHMHARLWFTDDLGMLTYSRYLRERDLNDKPMQVACTRTM